MTEPDFGSYLATVQERDIDLLLMEEFHVSSQFVAWFCNKVGLIGSAFHGAWHSVADAYGETDLLLRVRCNDKRFAVLIENKIGAIEQPDQDRRYHLRGARGKEESKFDEYKTCICAPQSYLSALPIASRYECRISYEEIRDWYASQSGIRCEWRRHIMSEAIEQGRRGYTMIVDEIMTKFHREYWEWITRRTTRLTMRKPTPKGKKSNWIILRGPNMPKGVSISHKNSLACVELTFDRTSLSELTAARSDWPSDIIRQQKGGSAVLGIRVAELDMTRGVADQEEKMREALAAAERLLEYCHILQDARLPKPS